MDAVKKVVNNMLTEAGRLVWVVRGSEDGNLGVYTKLPHAVAKALDYITGDAYYLAKVAKGGLGEPDKFKRVKILNPKQFRRVIKRADELDNLIYILSDEDDRVNVDIEGFNLNVQ